MTDHASERTARAAARLRTMCTALLVAVLLSMGIATAQASAKRSSQIEPGNFFNPNGVLYGYMPNFASEPNGSAPRVQASHAQVSYHQSQVGANVAVVHRFSGGWSKNFNEKFPEALMVMKASVDDDTVPMYSLGTPDSGHIQRLLDDDPAEIRRVQRWASIYLQSGIGPMFARLAHEPDQLNGGRPWKGNPELFIAWWRKFVTVVETDTGAYTAPTELIWQWSPTSWGFWHSWSGPAVDPLKSRAASLYPGDDWVDWVGSSGYDSPCSYASPKVHGKTHEEVLQPAASWASQVAPTKPFMLAEWGSEHTFNETPRPNTPNTRAGFFATTDDMLISTAPGFDQIAAIVYFDRHHNERTNPDGSAAGCNWLLHESSPRFPDPHLAYNQGRNRSVQVTNASDFEAYRSLVQTPGLFVAPGPF